MQNARLPRIRSVARHLATVCALLGLAALPNACATATKLGDGRPYPEASAQLPETYATLMRIGDASRAANELPAAVRLYRRANSLDPNKIAPLLRLGETLNAMQAFNEAATAYRHALKIDPIYLGILRTLNVEMGVITPPVGLNLFAVSTTARIPVMQVLKGAVPFFLGDLLVLLLVIFNPGLATWLPNQLVVNILK